MSLKVSLKHTRPTLTGDFMCPSGHVTAIWGPSGAGKSTAAQIITGLISPHQGTVHLNDRIILDTRRHLDIPPHKRRIGYVAQTPQLFPHLSAHQNLVYGLKRNRIKNSDKTAEVIERLALSTFLDQKPHTLSGGQKQRIALGRAFLQAPDALVLDEPLTGLDASLKQAVLCLLEEWLPTRTIPVVYISHMTDEIIRIADQLVCLEAGQVTWTGPVTDNAPTGQPDYWRMVNVLKAEGVGDTSNAGLSPVSVEGQLIQVPCPVIPKGAGVRLRVNSEAIMLAQNIDPKTVSANIILNGTVAHLHNTSDHVHVTVAVGQQTLNTTVTRKTVERMNLVMGAPIQAVCKTTNVRLMVPHGKSR